MLPVVRVQEEGVGLMTQGGVVIEEGMTLTIGRLEIGGMEEIKTEICHPRMRGAGDMGEETIMTDEGKESSHDISNSMEFGDNV